MISHKTAIAIITARSGSKGLPGKNTRPMCGKPLIAWSIEKAREAHHLDRVIVSTDSAAIAEVSRTFGAEVPFIRPLELATDTASTYDVLRHALTYFRDTESSEFDYTVLLEPTSPLREDGDIDAMLQMLDVRSDAFDAIISVGEVTHHPSMMKRLIDARIQPLSDVLRMTDRRQENDPVYYPYGGIFIAKTQVLLRDNTFYTQRCMGFQVKRYQNYDVDDLYDFLCTEVVMRHQWGLR